MKSRLSVSKLGRANQPVQSRFHFCTWAMALSLTVMVTSRLSPNASADDPPPATGPAPPAAPVDPIATDSPAASIPTTAAEADEYYALLRSFADAVDQVERNYVREISRKELMEAAINGVLSKLDEYSDYIPEDQFEGFQKEVENRFEGVGVQIAADPDSGAVRVIAPLVGSPAYRVGILAGDLIVKIDGQELKGLNLSKVTRMMQGPHGSKVTITVMRFAQAAPIDFEIERGEVRVETVMGFERKSDDSWHFFCDDVHRVGYVRVTAFAQHTPQELQTALEELQRQKMAGLVLDLRFNPGGMLPAAVEVADLFLDDGMIVSAEGRSVPKRVWEAKREGTFEGFPMAILVNRFSASASEIVAACLQDHVRAVVVGDRTWGKGSVQNLVQLEGGRGAIKITTASYRRPSGKNIQRFPDDDEDDQWGVQPTEGFEVEMRSRDQVRWLQWRRLHELAHGGQGQPTNPPAPTDLSATAVRPAVTFDSEKPADPQLDKGLAYLIEKIGGK